MAKTHTRRSIALLAGAGCLGGGHANAAKYPKEPAVDNFHLWFYSRNKQTWDNTSWMGVPVWKNPLDMWVYQEMLHEIKPDLLIECGTWKGGSALFFAHMLDILKKGRVVTIDIGTQPHLPVHPRITYIQGSSTAPTTEKKVRSLVRPGEKVMVALDSDHAKAHVLRECQIYSTLVTVGSYLVVEDTNANGNPVLPNFGPGPMEAVDEFMKKNSQFTIDSSREKYGVTFNPRGFLRRVK